MRRCLTLLIAVSVIVPAPATPAGAGADDGGPGQAAKEIADARDRADSAAQAYFDQESQLDQLSTQQEQMQTSIDELQRAVDELQARISAIAVNRYVSAGSDTLSLLTGFKSIDDQVQIDALIDVINASSADDFDRFHEVDEELRAQQRQLADTAAQAEQEQGRLEQLRQNALDEVARLKLVQADRLEDESVRKALAAEEAQRARAAVQSAAAAGTTTTTARAGQGAAAPTVPAVGRPSTEVGGANADDGGADPAGPGASAGTSTAPAVAGLPGGRTGPTGVGDGRQATGIGGVGGDYGGAGWMCPTGAAAVSFSDTWGAPRSGGRRHEGVDLIGPRGTPVLAVVDGVAVGKENELGGTTVSLTGVDGNRYYYAHLDGYVTLGAVRAGTVIGVLGQTGNAVFSVAHLHFEIHPGGGPAVDPFPTTRAHCMGG